MQTLPSSARYALGRTLPDRMRAATLDVARSMLSGKELSGEGRVQQRNNIDSRGKELPKTVRGLLLEANQPVRDFVQLGLRHGHILPGTSSLNFPGYFTAFASACGSQTTDSRHLRRLLV